MKTSFKQRNKSTNNPYKFVSYILFISFLLQPVYTFAAILTPQFNPDGTINTSLTNENIANPPAPAPTGGINLQPLEPNNGPNNLPGGNTGTYNPLNIDYSQIPNFDNSSPNTSWDADGDGVPDSIQLSGSTQQRQNQSGRPGTSGVNVLYPVGINVENAFDLESGMAEFGSCVGSLYLAEALKIPLIALDNIGDTIAGVIGTAIDGFAPFFAVSAPYGDAAGTVGDNVRDANSVDDEGADILEVEFLPAADSIAFCLKNVVVARMVGAIERWIDEGANNAAAYVEDFQTVLNDIAVISFEQAINDINICADIRGTVNLSAMINWLRTTRGQYSPGRCTLIFDREYELMLRGRAFSYRDFHETTQNPNNNAAGGSLLVASVAEQQRSILDRKYTTELSWSEGFWNWIHPDGRISSPGKLVTSKLLEKISLPDDSLVLEDDYDTIMVMIANQLIQQALADGFGI
jgi:hypothetical protein